MAEIDQLTKPPAVQGPFWNPFTKIWYDDVNLFTDSMKQAQSPQDREDSQEFVRKSQSDRGSRGSAPLDEETVRRRDVLVSVAVLGELEQYVGENIPPAKIRSMSKAKLDTLYAAYEAKLGQEITENGMEAFVGTAVKAISWLIPIDDQEKLKEDLMGNKPLRRSLGRYCAGVTERWGDLVAFAKVGYDVFKHVKGAPPLEHRELESSSLEPNEQKN